jgi:hypothetical protein
MKGYGKVILKQDCRVVRGAGNALPLTKETGIAFVSISAFTLT